MGLLFVVAPFRALPKIIQKLKEAHNVSIEEVREAFYNLRVEMEEELRPEPQRPNKKFWFISETDEMRLLKIVVLEDEAGLALITAYDPDEEDLVYYEKLKKKGK